MHFDINIIILSEPYLERDHDATALGPHRLLYCSISFIYINQH